MPEWTFLTNHALVLSYVARHEHSTAREISMAVGITERAVRKIIADLYDTGYIDKQKQGRRVIYSVNGHLSLRHHTHWEVTVRDFLEAVRWKDRP